MDAGTRKLVPTSRPHLGRSRFLRLRLAETMERVPRSPKAMAVLSATGSTILAWVVVVASH